MGREVSLRAADRSYDCSAVQHAGASECRCPAFE